MEYQLITELEQAYSNMQENRQWDIRVAYCMGEDWEALPIHSQLWLCMYHQKTFHTLIPCHTSFFFCPPPLCRHRSRISRLLTINSCCIAALMLLAMILELCIPHQHLLCSDQLMTLNTEAANQQARREQSITVIVVLVSRERTELMKDLSPSILY